MSFDATEVAGEPLVSIITPTFNSADTLRTSLETVFGQSYGNWELLIADDASTDGTAELIASIAADDDRVSFLPSRMNAGPAVARNRAIEAARGRYIAFLDSDDQWHPKKLERQIAYMQRTGYALTHTWYEKMDFAGRRSGQYVRPPAELTYRDLLKSCQIGCLTAIYDTEQLGKVYMPLIRKRQDYGLWLRILKSGVSAYCVPEVLAYYRIRQGSVSSNKLNLLKYNWRLYRDIERFSRIKSTYYVGWNVARKLTQSVPDPLTLSGRPVESERARSRVALVGNSSESLVRFRGDLIRELVAAGHSVYALAPLFRESDAEAIRAYGAHPVAIPFSRAGVHPARDIRFALRLTDFLGRNRIDRALFYTIKPVIYGSLAAIAAPKVRCVSMVTGLGYVFTPPGTGLSASRILLAATVITLLNAAIWRNRRVLVQNPDDRRWARRRMPLVGARVHRIYGSGVNTQSFPVRPLPERGPVFLMVARILREKGVVEYLRAGRRLKAREPDCRLLLVGPLDENPGAISAEELRAELSGSGVEYLGPVDDVRPLLGESSVFVLPSWREGTPRSALEAMATGRAVVTTDVPGCREIVRPPLSASPAGGVAAGDGVRWGENGALVPPFRDDLLAEAMREFVSDPGLAGRMGRAGRAYVEERYDVRRVNESIFRHLALSLPGPAVARVDVEVASERIVVGGLEHRVESSRLENA